MSAGDRLVRPATPAGFDVSRAAERAEDPTGWRYDDGDRETVHRVIADRRDIRRFRPDPVPKDVLARILAAAHRAPSVGLMQPWRFIVVREDATRLGVKRLAQRERLRQADRFPERAGHFLDQKIEGIFEAPLGIVVCCDHGDPDVEVLGRGTIPETDVYSTACAIENLLLAARAEGVGVGWVSFYRPDDLRALFGIPGRVDPMAYLCLGWPDERPVRPGLEASGWSARMPLDDAVFQERWPDTEPTAAVGSVPDRAAAIAARDRLDQLVKPTGSLGALETVIERWAGVTGSPPPPAPRAGVLICVADHGHVTRGTSLFETEVSGQVAAAAARGDSAVGVLAREGGHALLVADIGLVGPTPDGVRDTKVALGTSDFGDGPAMTTEQVGAALSRGHELAAELIDGGANCLVLGEIGIGNTTTAAALVGALTGVGPTVTVGRGTGMDAAGIERKRAVVADALERHGTGLDAHAAMAAVGGLELVALTGAMLEAAAQHVPVVLDGYAVTAAALAAVAIDRGVADVVFASHRSAEPGHALALVELGLEPILDLRLRLGEASGGLLALPIIGAAGALHRGMATFAEAGVTPHS